MKYIREIITWTVICTFWVTVIVVFFFEAVLEYVSVERPLTLLCLLLYGYWITKWKHTLVNKQCKKSSQYEKWQYNNSPKHVVNLNLNICIVAHGFTYTYPPLPSINRVTVAGHFQHSDRETANYGHHLSKSIQTLLVHSARQLPAESITTNYLQTSCSSDRLR